MNDLPAKIDQCSRLSLYADDTVLYHSSRDSAELKDTLESALDGVASWLDNNGLKMNVKKTQVMAEGVEGSGTCLAGSPCMFQEHFQTS